jgi:hypothetical protein
MCVLEHIEGLLSREFSGILVHFEVEGEKHFWRIGQGRPFVGVSAGSTGRVTFIMGQGFAAQRAR